ncbi:NAD(P)-dependent oxidoreductase [Enterococcus avium]|uniref:NAD-dependent epimerase/dehydratase family protein n=1 Tax=Enterococcus avium TaxID=33945 RepID=UPI001D090172|nr:NAD(P)-dependent oxidoreductase [Enterococcus avium]MCB6918484.1 NAD(P)-dependent oxidoreductase [Enterococcus avium]MCQ4962576.1 NAD(P)-dependent oxidoreductase [Enterococcus avium]
MKILVSGANGYLGKGIIDELIDKNVDVIATDLSVEGVNERAKKVEVDIFSLEDPYVFFDKPDIFLHLAWRDGFNHNAFSHIHDLSKHIELVQKFFKSGIDKISVMGSMHEVGFHEGSIDEYTQTNPMSYYGIAKDSLRKFTILMAEQYEKKFQWLRAFYIVGDTKDGSSIFSKIVLAEEEGASDFPFTTGNNQYDFLDYHEFSRMVAITILQDDFYGVINICSGYPTKLSDRVEQFILENNFKIKLKYGAFPDRKYDSKALWGDNKKIESIMEKEDSY